MSTITGNINKMIAHATVPNVSYELPIGEQKVVISDLLGQEISLSFEQQINCIHCHRLINKSFNQGYCYPCFRNLAQCDMCIMKPHTCHYHLGTCREPEWGESHCMQPHYVYLANSTHLKVGITRECNIPGRWLDQGALQALPIFRTKSRYQAGLIEYALTSFVSDKTNWRQLFNPNIERIDLLAARNELLLEAKDVLNKLEHVPASVLQPLDEVVREFHYPVTQYPSKIKSLGFDKHPEINGKLDGIKGQYLILDCGVINMRKHAGYKISLMSS